MSSFARLATVTASTKRSSGITSGKEDGYTAEIATLQCLPLDPVDPNVTLGISGLAFHELLQTSAEGGLDIVEGDLLVVDAVEYPIRAVADWDWKGIDYVMLLVEDQK